MGIYKDDRKIIEKSEDGEIAFLQTAASPLEAELICGLLRDAGVSCMAKDRLFGGPVKILAGISSFGTDIYVHRPQLEEARRLVSVYFDEQENRNVPTEEEKKEEEG